MEISPYLNFDGRCAEAFRFYERVLGGKIVVMQTHGESPMKEHVPATWHDRILHVRIEVPGGFALMGSDAPPDHFAPAQGMSVSVNVPFAEGERIFNALAEGGRVAMPFQKTFWAAGFGMLTDRFGTPWMVNSDK
jgi:PhnB protein